jgi:hypothetical protein
MTQDKRGSVVVAFLVVSVAVLACGPLGTTDVPPLIAEPPVGPAGRCDDGVCEGPENDQNCPQDCAATTPSTGASTACLNPNPHRAVVSEELVDFYNWLDGRSSLLRSPPCLTNRQMSL